MRLSEVNFIRKSWLKSFNIGIVYKRVCFKCICTTISRQYTELFYKLFTRATESGRSMGGCNLRNILPINVPKSKCYRGKNYVFWQETFKVVRIPLSATWSLPFHHGYCCQVDKLNIVVYRYRNILYLKNNEVDLKMAENQSILAKHVYLLSYIDIFYKRCIVLVEKPVDN